MVLIKSSTALKSFARRGAAFPTRQPFRSFTSTPSARAQGYGDGQGDPRGENPQEQGSSNATKHNAEHPGPEPPSEGQGTGVGPTKGGSGGRNKTPEDASAQSGGARSKEAKEIGSSPTGGKVGNSGGKSPAGGEDKTPSKPSSSPKIIDHEAGQDNSKEKDAEVEQHNREFEKGHDRADKPSDHDKVDSKFWSGHGGATK